MDRVFLSPVDMQVYQPSSVAESRDLEGQKLWGVFRGGGVRWEASSKCSYADMRLRKGGLRPLIK